MPGKSADHRLVDLTAKHHLHRLHGGFVSHAQAVHKAAFNLQPRKQGVDLRPAAMHHHKAHALPGKMGQIQGKGFAQLRFVHGVAAVFYDHCGLCHGCTPKMQGLKRARHMPQPMKTSIGDRRAQVRPEALSRACLRLRAFAV